MVNKKELLTAMLYTRSNEGVDSDDTNQPDDHRELAQSQRNRSLGTLPGNTVNNSVNQKVIA